MKDSSMHLYEAHYRRKQEETDRWRKTWSGIARQYRAMGWGIRAIILIFIVWLAILLVV